MPVVPKAFTIGLLVTALLEDRYNRTGHLRDEARRVAARYAERLGRFGHGRRPRLLRVRGRGRPGRPGAGREGRGLRGGR